MHIYSHYYLFIYAYLLDDDSEIKKAKGVKRFVIKHRLMFENYKDSLLNK